MFATTTAFLGLTFACVELSAQLHGDLAAAARDAISERVMISDVALRRLRAAGPAGLEVLLAEHACALDAYAASLVSPTGCAAEDPSQARLLYAIDTVAAQRDAFASRLYWHTDLDAAKEAALVSGRPILSLRMLGRLDDDLSCANSRFLRTAVYSNRAVSDALRERFVLHWQSERPVPTITIDFGDGRKLERTITGNCCHLVLDARGRVIDAIPGLYGPSAFLGAIDQAWQQHEVIASAGDSENRLAFERGYHAQRVTAIRAAWSRDLGGVPGAASVGASNLPQPHPSTASMSCAHGDADAAVPALVAAPIAMTKSGVEMPMLRLMAETDHTVFDASTDEAQWTRFAESKASMCKLDDLGLLVMRKVTGLRGDARAAGGPLDRKASWLEERLALDTVRNEYRLHHQIHEWLSDDPALALDAEGLTARIYGELFLTPRSDPWLGLVEVDAYVALDHDGAYESHGLCVPEPISK